MKDLNSLLCFGDTICISLDFSTQFGGVMIPSDFTQPMLRGDRGATFETICKILVYHLYNILTIDISSLKKLIGRDFYAKSSKSQSLFKK